MNDPNRRTVLNGLLAVGAATGTGAGAFLVEEPTLMSTPMHTTGFAETLHAPGPHPSLGRHADTFGRIIGSWAGEYRDRRAGQPEETGPMEVHFGWVLQGLAVQDTWIAPPRSQREGSILKRQTYGTTVRVFHQDIQAWRAVWLNPVAGIRTDLIGRRSGDDIVQFCLGADRPEKWVFSRITARSFLWQALVLEDDGLTWRADTEFQLHRID
jgi:hypothetical protein